MFNIYDYIFLSFLSIGVFLFLYLFIMFFKHHKSIATGDSIITNSDYNSLELVLETYSSLIKFFLNIFGGIFFYND